MKSPTILLTLLIQLGSFHASAQEDNFDDGDSNGWTELDPIGLITELMPGPTFPTVNFSVTNGEYRIRATAESPNPAALGPARGIAYRADTTFAGSFFMSVDIPAYDASLTQGFGLFAMMSDIGPGSTDGYALAYNPADGNLSMSVVIDEAPVSFLTIGPTNGDAGPALRLVFEGKNGVMTGRLYNLSDLTTPLITVTGDDTTYTSGHSGLFATNFDAEGNGLADATFDNYIANSDGLPELRIALLAMGVANNGANLDFNWDSKQGFSYKLWTTTDLEDEFPAEWTAVEVDGGFDIPASGTGLNMHSILRPGDPRRFYRVEEFPPPPAPG